MRKIFRPGNRPLRAVAAVATLLFLVILAFAASPGLHQAIHHDANDSHHHCAITMLAHGQLDAPTPDVFAVIASERVESFVPVAISFSSATFELLPPGRAPPFVS